MFGAFQPSSEKESHPFPKDCCGGKQRDTIPISSQTNMCLFLSHSSIVQLSCIVFQADKTPAEGARSITQIACMAHMFLRWNAIIRGYFISLVSSYMPGCDTTSSAYHMAAIFPSRARQQSARCLNFELCYKDIIISVASTQFLWDRIIEWKILRPGHFPCLTPKCLLRFAQSRWAKRRHVSNVNDPRVLTIVLNRFVWFEIGDGDGNSCVHRLACLSNVCGGVCRFCVFGHLNEGRS